MRAKEKSFSVLTREFYEVREVGREEAKVPELIALTKKEQELLRAYIMERLGFMYPKLAHEIARRAIRFALKARREEFLKWLQEGGEDE